MRGPRGRADYIKSRWSVDGYDWEVRFYPAMDSIGITCHLGCRLVDPNGNLKPSEEESVQDILPFPRFAQMQFFLVGTHEVAISGYLKNGSLTAQCTITLLKTDRM